MKIIDKIFYAIGYIAGYVAVKIQMIIAK